MPKRALLTLVLFACGAPAPRTSVVSVAPVDTHSVAAVQEAPHVAPAKRPFEIVMGYRSCILVHERLHCRDGLQGLVPFASERVAYGLESVDVTSASFGRDFGCVTTRAGDVSCFGGNHFGQLGANVRADTHDAPIALPGIHGAKRVYAGAFHACALLSDGKVSCWGKNQDGENGSSTNYLENARELVEPHIVPGVEDATELALGWDGTCAASRNGRVSCWGKARFPEQKTRGDSNEVPAALQMLQGATSLTANEETFCAVKEEKPICWGRLMTLLGGGGNDVLMTVAVPHAQRVSLGPDHACVLDAAGAVFCFGTDASGELGTPPGKDAYSPSPPMLVGGIPRAVDVMCGISYSCALSATNELWCWGRFSWETGKDEIHPPERIAIR